MQIIFAEMNAERYPFSTLSPEKLLLILLSVIIMIFRLDYLPHIGIYCRIKPYCRRSDDSKQENHLSKVKNNFLYICYDNEA